MAKDSMTKQERDWEAEDAARALIRAEEIRNKPALLKKAVAEMERQKKALAEALEKNPGLNTRMKRRNMI
uniref:Uncharacterized protein n=1 Tax=viral metagenome TaxID=1070528 RepID=A0A6M3JBS9_9ZZZZ